MKTKDILAAIDANELKQFKHMLKLHDKEKQLRLLEYLEKSADDRDEKVDKADACRAVYLDIKEISKTHIKNITSLENVLKTDLLEYSLQRFILKELTEDSIMKGYWEARWLDSNGFRDETDEAYQNTIRAANHLNRDDVAIDALKRLLAFNNSFKKPLPGMIEQNLQLVEDRRGHLKRLFTKEERYNQKITTILHRQTIPYERDYSAPIVFDDYPKNEVVIDLAANDTPLSKASLYMNLGFQENEPLNAINKLNIALENLQVCRKMGWHVVEDEQAIITNIALKYLEMDDFESADKYLDQLFKGNYEKILTGIYVPALLMKVLTKKYDEAHTFYAAHKQVLSKIKDVIESFVAMAYIFQRKPEKAMKFLNISMRAEDSFDKPSNYCLSSMCWYLISTQKKTPDSILTAQAYESLLSTIRNGRDALRKISPDEVDFDYHAFFELLARFYKIVFEAADERYNKLVQLYECVKAFRSHHNFWIRNSPLTMWLQEEVERLMTIK